jgi:hypothetical protein
MNNPNPIFPADCKISRITLIAAMLPHTLKTDFGAAANAPAGPAFGRWTSFRHSLDYYLERFSKGMVYFLLTVPHSLMTP